MLILLIIVLLLLFGGGGGYYYGRGAGWGTPRWRPASKLPSISTVLDSGTASRPGIDPLLSVKNHLTQPTQVMFPRSRRHGLIRKHAQYWPELESAIDEIGFIFTSRSAEAESSETESKVR